MNPDGRIEGLDAWRALLMLGGLVVHASQLQPPTALFDILGIVSGSFRMGAFFVLSGLFAGLALRRREPAAWLARRTFQIGVPTAFTLLVLCPIGTATMFAMPAGSVQRAPVLFDWQHAWFLVALLLYAPLAVWVHRRGERGALPHIKNGHPAALRWLVFAGLPLVSFVLMAAVVLTIAAVAPEPYWTTLSQWKFIVGYAPVYLLGLALARSAAVREALLGDAFFPAAILASVAGAYSGWYWSIAPTAWGQSHAWIGTLAAVAGSALCPPAASVLIIRSALKMPPMPAVVERLSDAAFTIYVVHFPLFLLLNLGFAHVDWNVYVEYAIVLIGDGGMTFLIHTQIVCRWRVAALLLNGKRLPDAVRTRTGTGCPAPVSMQR